jgi:hypothetical protein
VKVERRLAHLEATLSEMDRRFMEVINRIDARHDQFDEQAQRLQAASNEWRGALADRERLTVSRLEFDARTKAIEDKGDVAAATNAALLAALGSEMRLGFKSIEDKTAQALESLRLRNAESSGGKQTLNDARVWILGVFAAAASIMAVIAAIVAFTRGG